MSWQPTPELAIGTGALSALDVNRVDFVQEFGLEKERFRELRITLHPGRKHKIRFARVPITYAKDAVLTRTITLQGQTFTVGVPATADVKWDLLRAGYEWDFISRSHGLLGLIGELKYNKVSANVTSPIGNASVEQTAPVPTIGLIGRGYLHRTVSITAEFTGFRTPDRLKDTFDVTQYDLDLYATVSLGRFVGVQGGYRTLTADYQVDDDTGHLKMKGPYFGGLVRF